MKAATKLCNHFFVCCSLARQPVSSDVWCAAQKKANLCHRNVCVCVCVCVCGSVLFIYFLGSASLSVASSFRFYFFCSPSFELAY
jgi:hypothetical protein